MNIPLDEYDSATPEPGFENMRIQEIFNLLYDEEVEAHAWGYNYPNNS